jgi:uncharacterized protein (TIGR03382 family)
VPFWTIRPTEGWDAGAVAGGTVLLMLLALVAWFLLRRYW